MKRGCSILKENDGGKVVTSSGSVLLSLAIKDGLFMVNGKVAVPNKATQKPQAPQSCSFVRSTEITFFCIDPAKVPSLSEKCDMQCKEVYLARVYSKKEMGPDLLGVLHRRMSHASFIRVAAAFAIKLPPNWKPPLCDACVMSKSRNQPHHEGAKLRATKVCEGLHTDFCGPFPTTSINGGRYILVFVDDFTGFVWDFYPESQSEFFDIFSKLLTRLDTEFRQTNVVAWIRSDNALVCSEKRVKQMCEARGIRQEFSAPYSQWQNGKAERTFGTCNQLSTASLYQSGLKRLYLNSGNMFVH